MNVQTLPRSVIDFVRQYLHSIEQVEILLLLLRHRERFWTVDQIDNRIRTDPDSIRRRLTDLEKTGFILVGSEGSYRFTENEDLIKASESFAAYYSSHTTRIIEMIYMEPNAHTAFADAFKIRGEKDES